MTDAARGDARSGPAVFATGRATTLQGPGNAAQQPTNPIALTEPRRRVLAIVARSCDVRGYAPTLQEIADELCRSRAVAQEHVARLVADGFLSHERRVRRGLAVTAAGRARLAERLCRWRIGTLSADGCNFPA